MVFAMANLDNVQTLFEPDARAMREHLDFMFGGYLDGLQDGLIELAWTDTKPGEDGRYKLRHAELFGTDRIEDLIARAIVLNSQSMCNVYIGAALRRPETPPFGRASASDVLALTCAYIDLDEPGRAEAAKDHYGNARPGRVVVTGREPHTRAQMWWRLDEPITDQTASEALLKGMAAVFGSDNVSDPPRVMRLAGTIAWPVKPDRERPEKTFIAALREPGWAMYAYGHLAKVFPPVQSDIFEPGVRFLPGRDGIVRSTNVFGFGDKVEDGRERYMTKTINACLIELVGETGRAPVVQQLFDLAWPQYANNTDFSRSGRGQKEFGHKVVYTLKRFAEGKIRGCETIEKVQALYRQRQQAHKAGGSQSKYRDYGDEFAKGPKIDPETGEPLPLIKTPKQFLKDFRPPDYLVDGVIQKSYLYAVTARTGHGKTAIAMYLGSIVARGFKFHGRETEPGGVLFLAGENPDDIRARYLALAEYEGFDPYAIPFHFIDGVIDIKAEMSRIALEAAGIPNLSLVIIDTDQAYFLGDEGNSNEQRKWFARVLRDLLAILPGKPTILVNCHPVKNATEDNLVPIGGSAFLNEIDANLTLWADEKVCTLGPHPDKWRGVTFDSVAFELKTVLCEGLKDTKGRSMPSVIAVPITDAMAERRVTVAEENEKSVMRLLHADKRASWGSIAKAMGWMWTDGSPAKTRVRRIIERLCKAKLVQKIHGGKYRLTKVGCKVITVKWEGKDDED